MVFYSWNKQLSAWKQYECKTTLHRINTIKSVTFNVLFDKWKGKMYKENVIYSHDRYTDTLKKLSKQYADIITLNEVTDTLLKLIENCDWVREKYFISEITEIKKDESSIQEYVKRCT